MSVTINIKITVSNQLKVMMYFHSHFPDDAANNSGAIFDHMEKFIHWISNDILFIKDGKIYYTIDGCSKQYRCENSICLFSVLEFT